MCKGHAVAVRFRDLVDQVGAERGTGTVPDALGLIQADAGAARATVYNVRARAAGDREGGDE